MIDSQAVPKVGQTETVMTLDQLREITKVQYRAQPCHYELSFGPQLFDAVEKIFDDLILVYGIQEVDYWYDITELMRQSELVVLKTIIDSEVIKLKKYEPSLYPSFFTKLRSTI